MKIGIFGGTFDPPHIGHINACKCFLEAFDFDKLFVIPAYLPPHKEIKSSTTTEQRLEMTRLAFQSIDPKIKISDVEIQRKGKSYTAHTIAYFKECGYDDIYFLCGTDMLLTLDQWFTPEYIFANATIVCARRENDADNSIAIVNKVKAYEEVYGAKIIMLDLPVKEMSSTEIRESIHVQPCYFVSSEVYSYIKENNLYR